MKHFFFFVFLICYSLTSFPAVTNKVEPAQVHLGESFHLTITLIDETSTNPPNLIPLQADFTIDGTEHRASYTFINGESHNYSEWVIHLTPKRGGNLSIPALNIGQIKTKPLSINVEGQAKNTDDYTHTEIDAPLQITTKISEKNPYINQQILYTVKLYNRAAILNAAYEPPHLDEALMIPLGNREYQTIQNGQSYAVEEQNYAFFPQKSGQHTITPPTLRALMYDNPPRQIRAQGNPISLNIKSIPSDYTGKHWLPAKSVTLTEISQSEENTVTRLITIQGIATPAELLILPTQKSTADYRVYAEKPKLENSLRGEDIMGTSTIKLTYIVKKSGSITLPAISITWFNLRNQKQESSVLPAKIIHLKTNIRPKKAMPRTLQKGQERSFHYPYFLSILIVILLLGMIYFYFKKRKFSKSNFIKHIEIACKNNDCHETQKGIISWAKNKWPDQKILNLNDVKSQILDEKLLLEIQHLSNCLYHKKQKWEGNHFWKAFSSSQKIKPKFKKKTKILPTLHPTKSKNS